MAWIQSHQTLSDHPKTRKLIRLLGTSKAATIGHLHCLWWWAFDYAEDGALDRFDAMDIAIAAEWEGEPDQLVEALISAGFLDRDNDGISIHDWDQYGGKLHARREADAERKRQGRREDSEAKRKPVQRTSNGRRADGKQTAHVDKKREERVEREKENTDAPNGAQEDDFHPFSLLEALCETLGQDTSVLTQKERGKQLTAGKRLIADGVTPNDVSRITRWLLTQTWRSTVIDLYTVEKEMSGWKLAGKPETAIPGALRVHAGGRADDPNINPDTGKPYAYNDARSRKVFVG